MPASAGPVGATRFAPGTSVALRELWMGRVWKARPAIVVRDDEELVALWTPEAAPMLIADTGSGVPAPAWSLIPFRSDWECLRLTVPGAPLVHTLTRRGGALDGWHVDVVRPFRRFASGFEYLDLELDILVAVDGTAAIVDEDEFEESCRRGVIDAREASAVRRAAEAALASARASRSPFSDRWETWEPDTGWPEPTLPPGWDAPAPDLQRLR